MSIFELVKNEARIFKYGSGAGANFSSLRGCQETLSGGGTSSGLMSFLEVFDRAAGATKSGGTTRRAAKMVCLDADHPEIREFVNWKRNEEKKARALIEKGYSADFNGEAYHTISGQNSNNSVRVSDAFMRACESGDNWSTIMRTNGAVCDTFPARALMRDICESAWECADPGVQFDTTINAWHTCPESGPIRASNPCSEYMFVDDSACNLASINLLSYLRADGSFDIPAFLHTIRVFIVAQEILVDASSFPTDRIARNSHLFRPLGLGYANLGAALMALGLAYDSDEGRAWAGAVTALMTGHAYRVSAEMAAAKGPFEEYEKNAAPMLGVIERHREAVNRISRGLCPAPLLEAAREAWDKALEAGRAHGYRNAQLTVLAPTGTIGLLMDCDTTGVEPDFALVKFKKLAGGGYFKIVNQTVARALDRLGYSKTEVDEILIWITGTQNLEDSPHINRESLKAKGLTDGDLDKIARALPGSFDLDQAFAPHVLGEEGMARLGVASTEYGKPDFRLLRALGFSPDQIEESGERICGAMTVEGAPCLKKEHYSVFDCASPCGKRGTRFIDPKGHIRMMAATQPFLCGAISKTVNLPHSCTVEEIEAIYRMAWQLGLKAVAVYRDGCKSSQPLNVKRKEDESVAETEEGQLELFPELVPKGLKRRELPKRRRGITVEGRVGGHKVFLRTGEYEDGSLGEVFIDMHKEGSAFRSMMMCFAIAISKGLQYGVPLSQFVDTFTFTNFEPKGVCDHPNVKMASSVIDFVFRVLGLEYLGRTDLCQVKPEEIEERPEPKLDRLVETVVQVALPEPDKNADRRVRAEVGGGNPLNQQMRDAMSDAPFCDICGHITVRNGSCYKCLNCGNSMGCS
jgi:ribonucleoside-diphosphate reductase alpha chain